MGKIIANTIREQIFVTDPMALWAWGATNFTSLHNDGVILGGLGFKVRGAKFKGIVKVKLMPSDTYNVELETLKGVVKKIITDVYCDQLMTIIDREIER
jgi:hypothetical protein